MTMDTGQEQWFDVETPFARKDPREKLVEYVASHPDHGSFDVTVYMRRTVTGGFALESEIEPKSDG
jgi:hypothetical protein